MSFGQTSQLGRCLRSVETFLGCTFAEVRTAKSILGLDASKLSQRLERATLEKLNPLILLLGVAGLFEILVAAYLLGVWGLPSAVIEAVARHQQKGHAAHARHAHVRLSAVRERWPETVRLMLTGHAQIQTAIDAVKDGCIFRFLTKPCSKEVLQQALRAALAQYDLVVGERELLEKTLHGSVKVLTEILALVNPAAFCRSSRIHRTMEHIADTLGLREAWR